MLITRKDFDRLDKMNLNEADCVYLCPVCGEISDILPSKSLIEEIECIKCSGVMELLMLEIKDEEEEEK